MRVHRKNVVGLLPFVLFIILLLFNACTGESDSGSIGSTGSIIFSIRLDSPTIESTDRLATAINCAATGISTVEGEVFDESNSSIASGGPWACSDGSGVISNVEAGSNRRVVILGKDSSGNTLFRGESTGIDVVAGGSSNAGTIDLKPEATDTVTLGNAPFHIAVAPNGNFAYVTDIVNNTVSVIQTSDNTVINTISMGNFPYGIDVTPNGNLVYVTNNADDTVSVIQTSTNTVIGAPITVGGGPNYVVVTPSGNYVYVTNWVDGTVSVIRTSDNTVVGAPINVGVSPHAVAVTPQGDFVYVTNFNGGTVSVIRTSDNTVTETISVGNEPFSLLVSTLGRYVFVVNRADDTMSVIQTSDNTELYKVPVGDFPQSVAVKPSGDWIYVTNTADDTMSVLAGYEVDDAYEENNALATAWHPGYNWETIKLSNIDGFARQRDDDWYEIDVTTGFERVQIDCQFTHADGDIDIELYDSSGNLKATSDGETDNEYIDFTVSGSGTYYIRVYYGNQGNTYDLWWDQLFYDGFEDGDFSDWNIGSGTYSRWVTSSASASGTYSFTQTGGDSSTHYEGVNKTFSNPTPTYISFYAMSSSTSTSDAYFVITDNLAIIFFYFQDSGELVVYDGSQWISGGTYTANTWYHIEFKNIDWSNKTYDFYVNDVLASSGVDFWDSSATSMTQIYLYNYDYSQAWWDEIEMN